jgi:hypothetical protein
MLARDDSPVALLRKHEGDASETQGVASETQGVASETQGVASETQGVALGCFVVAFQAGNSNAEQEYMRLIYLSLPFEGAPSGPAPG